MSAAEQIQQWADWLAAHDAEVAAKALMDAADAMWEVNQAIWRDPESVPSWISADIGYYGEMKWLRARADDLAQP